MAARDVTRATDHVALAHFRNGHLEAEAWPCELRRGVWVVHRTRHKRPNWVVSHAPSGSAVGWWPTRKEAAAVCAKLGEAYGQWAWAAGFGEALTLPTEAVRVAGLRAVEGVG